MESKLNQNYFHISLCVFMAFRYFSIIFATWTFPGLFFFIFLFNTTVDSNLKWPMIRLERKIFEFEGTPPTTVPQPLNALREFFA